MSTAEMIAEGERFLESLPADDPKRRAAEAKIERLRRQLERENDFGRFEPPFIEVDPRPDLVDDSEKWGALLKMALELDAVLCGVLNGMRCGGTRIRPARTGSGEMRWILRPDFDPSGRLAWQTQADYEEARDKYLKPQLEEVSRLLQGLTGRFPPAELVVQQEMRI